jgi:hypothetical protein
MASRWGRLAAASGAEDEPGLHGMLVTGQRTVFLSHLPMFGPPHDYQVILEAALSKSGGDPQADYFNDRKRTGATLYTLEPERFVLPRLAAVTPLRSFKANVYRGHFERFPTRAAKEAARIAQNVDVTVTRVIHFRRFDPAAAKPAQLEYLLFGKGGEVLAAHLIIRPPDFDQIVPVTALDRTFADSELSAGVRVVIPSSTNAAAGRMAGVDPITGQIKNADGATATVRLQPGVEVYFEQNELAV